jgi:hypothetical protein
MKLFPEYYDSDTLCRLAILLYDGWGYNLFKVENQMRADSILIRAKVSTILGQASDALKAAESAWRGEKLPPPSRENPRPDPAALDGARKIEALVREVGRIEGLIRSAPVPEKDRLLQRYRRERNLLERLVISDQETVGKAEILRRGVAGKSGQWLLDNEAEVRSALASLAASITERSNLLTI